VDAAPGDEHRGTGRRAEPLAVDLDTQLALQHVNQFVLAVVDVARRGLPLDQLDQGEGAAGLRAAQEDVGEVAGHVPAGVAPIGADGDRSRHLPVRGGIRAK
jgi:prolyl-tRNA editing enzyme YbaK/EbsC (Cys-tRNA(Pro) deacylase)